MKQQRKRRSPIWLMSVEEFEQLVKQSSSLREILNHFGFGYGGNSFEILKKRIKEEGIDASHLQITAEKRTAAAINFNTIPLEEILVENSTYTSTQHLKKRLLKERLLENKCSECDLGPIWNNKPISLQLEHKNGIRNDHRIENLTILCPNCHSQTDTFAGKRFKKSKKS